MARAAIGMLREMAGEAREETTSDLDLVDAKGRAATSAVVTAHV
jgi:hypothetical protein